METVSVHLHVTRRDVRGHMTGSLQVKMQNVSYLYPPQSGVFREFTAYLLHTIQWKHLQIAFIYKKYHFYFAKTLSWQRSK